MGQPPWHDRIEKRGETLLYSPSTNSHAVMRFRSSFCIGSVSVCVWAIGIGIGIGIG
jgi:hypothetical protein